MIYNTWVGGMKIDYVKQDTAIPTQIYDFFKLSKELYMIHNTYTYIHVIHNTVEHYGHARFWCFRTQCAPKCHAIECARAHVCPAPLPHARLVKVVSYN